MEYFNAEKKLALCDIRYHIRMGESYIFDYSLFSEQIIKPYLKQLPFLYEYSNGLYQFGEYFNWYKRDTEKDQKDKSFAYCYHLLEQYKSLLEGYSCHISIFPGAKNGSKINKVKDCISDEQYKNILKLGLEGEIRKYKLDYVRLTRQQAEKEIENGKNSKWVCFKVIQAQQLFPYLTKEEIEDVIISAYIGEFPVKKVDILTVEFINQLLKKGEDVNKEQHYIQKRGRPTINIIHECLQRLWLLLTIDSEIESSNGDNKKEIMGINKTIRYEFIYDFIKYFELYNSEETIKPSTKASKIASLFTQYNTNKTIDKGFVEKLKNKIHQEIFCKRV